MARPAASSTTNPKRETFPARAVRRFGENMRSHWDRVGQWHERILERLGGQFDRDLQSNAPPFRTIAILVAIWLGIWGVLVLAVLIASARGGLGPQDREMLMGGSCWFSVTLMAFVVLGFLAARRLSPLFVVAALAIWTALCFFWELLLLVLQLLLLVPLVVLFLVTRLQQLWRGIFFTCPARQCAYRGLPAYVCDQCGLVIDHLWPSFYGVLWHHCPRCDRCLATFDFLGRNTLARRCGSPRCRIPLVGRHAGLAPERLVAIVGGPSSGKTCYLLSTVRQLLGEQGRAAGMPSQIDDPELERKLPRLWNPATGQPPPKTVDVPKAFLLYTHLATGNCQLYLYDAPGEEFESVSSMSKQQYFPLLAGLVLLVDPMSFEAIAGHRARQERASLDTVVSTTLGTALGGMRPGSDGKYGLRVAVVISKADLPAVRETIGDVREGPIRSAKCRKAIADWGGQNALRALEQRFRTVEYFACSPLGRTPDARRRQPFRGSGLLEPIRWVLAEQPRRE